jgi:hypothetical protein
MIELTGVNMPKIKLPTVHGLFDESLNTYQSMFMNMNDSLKENLLKIKPLMETGVLTKEAYGLFDNDYRNFELNMALMTMRDSYIRQYGFYIVSEGFIENTVNYFGKSKILEVGAGSGFLSACLQNAGIDIVPTEAHLVDNHYGFKNNYTEIIEEDSIKYLKNNKDKFDTILMSWPNYSSPFAYQIAKNMASGQTLIYIGEGYGGCTADDRFFDYMEKYADVLEDETHKFNESSFSWSGIHDRVRVFKKK